MYSIDDIIKIGSKEAIRKEADFEELELYCSIDGITYEPKHFGIYQMFTEESQHTYGTEDELLFMLGALKILKKHNIKEQLSNEKVYEIGMTDTINNMKDIANQYGINLESNNFDMIYDELEQSKKFSVDNYYSDYRNGKYDYYNLYFMLKDNNLLK